MSPKRRVQNLERATKGRGNPQSRSGEPFNPILQEQLNRALDATKSYGHAYREGGSYGSHPSHDDYDEGGS